MSALRSFSSALLKANALDLTETFRNYVWKRLEKLREYPDEDSEETPVDDIERVLGQCKQKFAEIIDSVAEEALFAAEMAFRAKIDRSITSKLQEVIDEELYR